MDIFDAIATRRSEAHLLQREVDHDIIVKVLSAGTWAPNHHLTEPWHFYIFQGKSREKLAEALMVNFHRDHPDASPSEIERARLKNPRRVMRTPLCVIVTSKLGKNDIETHENYGACCCAVQNILLAAHAVGLGVYWRTGDTIYTKPSAISEAFDIPTNEQFVSLLLMGYPDPGASRKRGIRKPLAEKMTIVE